MNKPSIYVDLSVFRGLPDKKPSELEKAKDKFLPFVQNAFNKSGLFSSYTFDEKVKSDQDYTIEIDIYNHGNEALAFLSGFITGYSLGVIPGAATDNYTLNLKAKDSTGRVLSELSNKDSVQIWVGLWFIPVMNKTPGKAIGSTLENQILTALKELFENGVMKYSCNTCVNVKG